MSKINKAIAALSVVASLGVAAAPMATFAEVTNAGYASDTHTDTFRVTVLPTCSFGSTKTASPIDGITHNTGSDSPDDANASNIATWDASTGTTNAIDGVVPAVNRVADDKTGMTPDISTGQAHASTHLASYRIYAGTTDNDFAETTLTVVCNQPLGYKIQATGTSLASSTTGATAIAFSNTYSTSASGYGIVSVAPQTGSAETATGATPAEGDQALEPTAGVIAEVAANSAESAAGGDSFLVTYGIGVASAQKATTYQGTVTYDLYQQVNSN